MSTHQTELFSTIPQTDLFDLFGKLTDTLGYCINRVCGCWHLNMTRPITHGRETYRSCVRCGMHRSFDPDTWKSCGRFYSANVERRGS
jgi:hypothetical protein